jgi:hypothetical protein
MLILRWCLADIDHSKKQMASGSAAFDLERKLRERANSDSTPGSDGGGGDQV